MVFFKVNIVGKIKNVVLFCNIKLCYRLELVLSQLARLYFILSNIYLRILTFFKLLKQIIIFKIFVCVCLSCIKSNLISLLGKFL